MSVGEDVDQVDGSDFRAFVIKDAFGRGVLHHRLGTTTLLTSLLCAHRPRQKYRLSRNKGHLLLTNNEAYTLQIAPKGTICLERTKLAQTSSTFSSMISVSSSVDSGSGAYSRTADIAIATLSASAGSTKEDSAPAKNIDIFDLSEDTDTCKKGEIRCCCTSDEVEEHTGCQVVAN